VADSIAFAIESGLFKHVISTAQYNLVGSGTANDELNTL
jgi:hypothetical protein